MNTNSTPNEELAARITAYALGQLSAEETAEVEQLLVDPAQESLRQQLRELRRLEPALQAATDVDTLGPSAELRKAVERKLDSTTVSVKSSSGWKMVWVEVVAGSCVAALLAMLFWPADYRALSSSTVANARRDLDELQTGAAGEEPERRFALAATADESLGGHQSSLLELERSKFNDGRGERESDKTREPMSQHLAKEAKPGQVGGLDLAPRGVVNGTTVQLPDFAFTREAREIAIPKAGKDVAGSRSASEAKSLMMMTSPRIIIQEEEEDSLSLVVDGEAKGRALMSLAQHDPRSAEQYELPPENPFRAVREAPLSTFSIDVDTASYANVRRMLQSGRLPPPAAVRIEEFVNYFTYRYPQPTGDEPFSVNLESAECPWQPGHLLLRVGLKGKEIHRAERPASNLVFLVDVSGSMTDENKLPLLKTSLAMMAAELKHSDRVSLVTYAGEAGTKLDSARGDEKETIRGAIEALHPGGSTHGSAGIQVAYDLAKKNFIAGGVNRVIWATDGDLNVGITDDNALVNLIKEKAASGVFLTVLGVGEGNLKDAKLEKLADNGNGLYAYLDSVKEARKVLIEQMSGSLVTIAKDVKLQIEFNPAQIASYRLIGYENRMLAARDFADDKKDAGEIGAGHTVTALYELVPAGGNADKSGEQPTELKYQKGAKVTLETAPRGELSEAAQSGELLTLKLRYKQPDADRSVLREFPLKEKGGRFGSASPDFQFASAVAQFGMLLRGSQHRGSSGYSALVETASATIGDDPSGLRAELLDLLRKADQLGKK